MFASISMLLRVQSGILLLTRLQLGGVCLSLAIARNNQLFFISSIKPVHKSDKNRGNVIKHCSYASQ